MAHLEDAHITNLRIDKLRVNGVNGNIMWQDVAFTVTAEVSNEGDISIQLKDGAGNNLPNKAVVDLYISSTAGAVEAGTGPSGTVVIDTNGVIINTVTDKKYYRIQSDATGLFDLTITDSSGTVSFFINIVHPVTGEIYSSATMDWT